jgi:hypothetical protein
MNALKGFVHWLVSHLEVVVASCLQILLRLAKVGGADVDLRHQQVGVHVRVILREAVPAFDLGKRPTSTPLYDSMRFSSDAVKAD